MEDRVNGYNAMILNAQGDRRGKINTDKCPTTTEAPRAVWVAPKPCVRLVPKWPNEDTEAHKTRLAVATLFPAYQQTIEVLGAKPFSKPVAYSDDVSGRLKDRCGAAIYQQGATTLKTIPFVPVYGNRQGYMQARPALLEFGKCERQALAEQERPAEHPARGASAEPVCANAGQLEHYRRRRRCG